MVSGTLNAAGGLGLFLLGMVVMTRGLKSLSGDTLRRTLARFTTSPLSGAVTGATATALVQSSSAVTVMAVGFVSTGLLTFSQALGIIFGANIGTTITGWIVAIVGFKLKLGEMALPIIFVGVLIHLFTKRRASDLGLAIAGFGLIFVGIDTLQNAMAGLEGVVTPASFPDDTLLGRILLVLIGVAITLVTQSSSAGIATALAAVNADTITFPQAAAMVIGMDVGTTATALFATIGASTDARRTGFAHVIYNLLTGVGAFCLLTPFTWACKAIAPTWLDNNPEIALVGFHSLFNTLGVLVILPFTGVFAKFMIRLIPEKPTRFTERLDPSLYESPAIAIEAVRATLRDLTLVVFEQLSATLQPKSTARDSEKLLEANAALKQSRDYLAPIDASAASDALYPKYTSAFHVIDHLRRLIDRGEEAARVDTSGWDSRFDSQRTQLLKALEEACGDLQEQASEAHEETLKNVWEECEKLAEPLRHAVVEDAASRRINADLAIGRLDDLRWLRRVAYHAWRIVHHLRRSQLDNKPDERDDVPPHQELEVGD